MRGRPRYPRVRQTLALVTAAVVALSGCAAPTSSTEGSVSTSATPRSPLASAARLDAAIAQTMADKSIPGVIVGVWGPAGDYVRAFGVADKVTHSAMREDFYSRIGSVTKTFTVTAILQLLEQGKLQLDDPIAKYIPGVRSGDEITLRMLAQMQSGLITYDDVAAFTDPYIADPNQSYTPAQLIAFAVDKPLQFPPGTQYQYCNTNIVLLGLVVEKQSGQRLPDYISEHILAPLNMSHTSFRVTAAFPDPHAQGYTVIDGLERNATDWNPSWGWGAGNIVSTLADMRIWAHALATGTLLAPATQRQRLDTTVPMSADKYALYGLGLFNDGGWVGHTGIVFGYQTAVFYLPQTQTTLVFFANTDSPHDVGNALAHAITSIISPDHVFR